MNDRERRFAELVGAEVRECRKRRALSQDELSKRLGIKKVTLLSYEKGYSAIPLYLLLKTAALLNASLSDVLTPAIKKHVAERVDS